MKKPKLIIIEGSQGVGKGTITNMLREKIPYSTLMRLSGIKDNSFPNGYEKIFKIRKQELEFIKKCSDCETTFILDRSYLTEKIYCNLGYKNYNFKADTDILNNCLNSLTDIYDVYIILLTLNDYSLFEKRLKRNKAEYEHSKFSVKNSIKQQFEYIYEIEKIRNRYPNIKCKYIENHKDPIDTFKNIMEFLELKELI